MALKALSLSLIFFALALFCQRVWIVFMRHWKMGQIIKEYGVQAHMKKTGTPSMGGVVALCLLPLAVILPHLVGVADARETAVIWAYPALAAFVGLIDDALKLRSHSSEGLRSLQKLFLQFAVTIPWAYFVSFMWGGVYLIPSLRLEPMLGAILLTLLGVGVQNAVNVTDGLDGLAGGAVAISLMSVFFWGIGEPVLISAVIGIALVLAFLWHNCNPAELFMGDVGAHLWAGLLVSLCVASKSLIYIVPVGFLFGVEIVTVTIQIVAIRCFKRKVFLMSPMHHHFELLEWSEPKIVTRFWLIHLAGLVAIFVFILAVGGGS